MKWNTNNISLFLRIYRQFPTLWSLKEREYNNKSLRDASFNQLMCELKENELLGKMDARQVRAKIKSIKDVYRTEVHKVDKSKKSGCATEDVYVPKLIWFHEAAFLSEVTTKIYS